MFFELFSPHKRPQRTRCTLSVQLASPLRTSEALVLPIPRSTESQEIDGAPEYSIKPTAIRTDPVHGNLYGIWQGVSVASETFIVHTKPTKIIVANGWHLSDYRERPQSCLEANQYIAPNDEQIRGIANEIMRDTDHVATLITRAYQRVQEALNYGNPIVGLYSAIDALTKKTVDCGGYDTLLASLLIACGIPARIVSGFWITQGEKMGEQAMHAWVEALLPDNTWIPLDPSVETLRCAGRSKRIGGIGRAGSDRIILSYGCNIPIEVNGERITVPILQMPLLYPTNNAAQITTTLTCTRL